jgi:hypothetical protein
VLTRPQGLTDTDVAGAVSAGWDVSISDIEYAPVGFGSFHWRARSGGKAWFVTADDTALRRFDPAEPTEHVVRRLGAALRSALALRESGCEFVVAPITTVTGAVLHLVADRWIVCLYPFVDGRSQPFGPYPTDATRHAVVELVAATHAATDAARDHAMVDDFTIPYRDGLIQAMADGSSRWHGGPYAEPARRLLRGHVRQVEDWLARHDDAASRAADHHERMVLTHGEPHAGNTMETAAGVVLIDWDTALIAPPERDLWMLAAEDPSVLDRYAAHTGVQPRDDWLALYRLRWAMTDVSQFVQIFRHEHDDDADTRIAWRALADVLGRSHADAP